MGRRKKDADKGRQAPKPEVIEALAAEMEKTGERPQHTEEGFRDWFKYKSEKELWFFSRWVLSNDYLSLGDFHRKEVCPFLSDFSNSRFKLLMLPMGHLKTTIASRSLPLHMLIQPAAKNPYMKNEPGCNMRVLLANENEQKAKDNLNVMQRQMQDNDWLYWMWPHIFFANPKQESPRWTDFQVEVKRSRILAEASIGAVGIKTGFIGKYFDAIIPDDIAALEASQNPPLMERAKKWRRSARTRFYDKQQGIYIGVGTHWGSNDVYVEWKKDPQVEVMIRSAIEYDAQGRERALWPEKFPLDVLHQMRDGTDPIEWALWYMNKPVPSGYTALNWEDLREYQMSPDGRELYFNESVMDDRIQIRQQTIRKNLGFTLSYDPQQAKLRSKPPKGMDVEYYDHMREKYKEKLEREVPS